MATQSLGLERNRLANADSAFASNVEERFTATRRQDIDIPTDFSVFDNLRSDREQLHASSRTVTKSEHNPKDFENPRYDSLGAVKSEKPLGGKFRQWIRKMFVAVPDSYKLPEFYAPIRNMTGRWLNFFAEDTMGRAILALIAALLVIPLGALPVLGFWMTIPLAAMIYCYRRIGAMDKTVQALLGWAIFTPYKYVIAPILSGAAYVLSPVTKVTDAALKFVMHPWRFFKQGNLVRHSTPEKELKSATKKATSRLFWIHKAGMWSYDTLEHEKFYSQGTRSLAPVESYDLFSGFKGYSSMVDLNQLKISVEATPRYVKFKKHLMEKGYSCALVIAESEPGKKSLFIEIHRLRG